MKRASVFCSRGIGDGLIFFALAYNLHKNGYLVDVYHDSLDGLNEYFPSFSIKNYSFENIEKTIDGYDLIIINSNHLKINKQIISYAKKTNKNTHVLHPSVCKGSKTPLGDFVFDIDKNVVVNLIDFCKNTLGLKNLSYKNGMVFPKHKVKRKYPKRVVIHPTSSSLDKNWEKKKFLSLYKDLQKKGYDPFFIMTKQEKTLWQEDVNIPIFENIKELASFIYESGFMIGNDSGIAHLASSLHIPNLTIFSSRRKIPFWVPFFYKNKSVSTLPLINIKGLRLRDKYWQKMISKNKVFRSFKKLVKEYESSGI